MKHRIKSDRYDSYMKMDEYGMGYEMEHFPVDLYGKRVFPNKGDANNLQNAAQDVREYHDLETQGLKGGE